LHATHPPPIQRVKEDTKTAGGIIIPDTATEKPSEGKVIAVGPGLRQDDGNYAELDVVKTRREHRPILSTNTKTKRNKTSAGDPRSSRGTRHGK